MTVKKARRGAANAPPPMQWKRWFAWRPILIRDALTGVDNRFWLCFVERRWFPAYGHDKGYWEYKEEGSSGPDL